MFQSKSLICRCIAAELKSDICKAYIKNLKTTNFSNTGHIFLGMNTISKIFPEKEDYFMSNFILMCCTLNSTIKLSFFKQR